MKIDISRGWLADFLPFAMPEGGLTVCKNLLPLTEYYYPFPGKKTYSSNSISGTPLIGKRYKNPVDGTHYTFIGTSSKLYRLESTKALTDVSKTGGYTGSFWSFTPYGSTIVATNFTEPVQKLTSFQSGTNFEDLGGSPPRARYAYLDHEHLILGNIYESSTSCPKKVRWSARGNIESWTASLTTGADSQALVEADGDITGIASMGSAFAIFHENSITIGWYAGGIYTFNFNANKVKNVGAIPGSIISIGSTPFFFDERDIYYFDGNVETPIGYGIRKTFLRDINYEYKNRINAYYDPVNRIIMWAYPSLGSTGTPDKILLYNIADKKYAIVEIDTGCIFSVNIPGTLLDAMTGSPDSNYTLVDSWGTNAFKTSCINPTDSKVATFDGNNLDGIIETAESNVGKIVYINSADIGIHEPVGDVKVSVGYRYSILSDVSYTQDAIMKDDGIADIDASGKYLRMRVKTKDHQGLARLDVNGMEIGN